MKKLLLSLFAFLLVSVFAFSQEEQKKALAKAGKALTAYNLNPADNAAKLTEAKESIDMALTSEENMASHKAWQTKGDIYLTISDKDLASMTLGNEPTALDAPLIAAEAFEKSLSLAVKKFEIKDAVTGLTDAAKKLNMISNYQINNKDYAGGYKTLKKVLEAHNILTGKGEEPVIAQADMANHKFVMAFCAQASGEKAAAKGLFKELYEQGTEEPTVYAQYFTILLADKDPNALDVINKGRSKFPGNSEILFALINYYIQIEDFVKLEKVLLEAIQAEPTNPSVRLALGNVYMNLFSAEYEKNGDNETAKGYFAKSIDYFQQAIGLDPKLFDAYYSIGSLYFNKAVEIIKVANGLPLTESKKYDAMTKEANGLMEQALPQFKKAESINANDANTLIALGEIFARMNDFEKSNEFKTRLTNVKEGRTNPTSYFKE